MKPLCIWHGNCQDGFGAAWSVRHALGDVEFYPGVYQSEPPDVTDRDVIMVDFSYKRPVIDEMSKTARSILILDHHKSALEDLVDIQRPPQCFDWATMLTGDIAPRVVHAIFDMERSGAGLTWDYFHPYSPRPLLINHIEDRDLWQFKLEGTREISAALFSYPYEFELWSRFMSQPLDHLIRGRVPRLSVNTDRTSPTYSPSCGGR